VLILTAAGNAKRASEIEKEIQSKQFHDSIATSVASVASVNVF
jgi:hypothetical protein